MPSPPILNPTFNTGDSAMNIYTNEKTIFDYKHPIQNNSEPYYGYVYFSYNTINGKKYVGQSGKQFKGTYFGSGRRISQALKKYKKENFLVYVIEWCGHKDTPKNSCKYLDEREEFWLKFFNAKPDPKFYNIIDTATPSLRGEENGFYGKKHKKESIEKRKETLANKSKEQIEIEQERKRRSYAIFLNSSEGLEYRKRISERLKGKKQSKELVEKRFKSLRNRSVEDKIVFSNNVSAGLLKFYQTPKGIEARAKFSKERKNRKMPEGFAESVSKRLKGVPKTKEHIDKVNKNPEKIRKTAEKHRGMKRTQETKNNISKSKKGKPARNKGEVWYYDPINKQNKAFLDGDIPPQNWVKGTGRVVYHDPETLVNYTCWEGEQDPNWIKGRYIKRKGKCQK